MLRYLCVRHLAVIDHLEVEFEPGLNVLTGETGAGKSIVVEAIDLLMGGRSSAELVRTGEDSATIQAILDRPDGSEVIVRREISAQGRSRAFIDDTLATTAALRELGAALIDLHGQHEHQTLLDPSEHADLLDGYGELGTTREIVDARFEQWRATRVALDRTRLDDREKEARTEIAAFHLQEIDKVNPAPDEDERLAVERTVLANVDRLSRLSNEAYAALYEGEASSLATLSLVWKRLSELSALDPRFAPHLERRDDVKSVLEDLAFFLRSYVGDLEASPDRLQAIEDRLAAIDRLKRKHGPNLSNVLERRDALREELAALGSTAERVTALEAQLQTHRASYLEAARALSADRRVAASRLGRALVEELAELAMPRARFEVRVTSSSEDESSEDRWTRGGIDRVEFLVSPNPGEDLRPLERIASGGELSRIMLGLRSLASNRAPGRTVIFDEVDAGIGGEAASAVGVRLQALGSRDQVLCVTHLPQIAARAGAHFQVAKQVKGGRTVTTVTKLDGSSREGEIARMIAGAEVSRTVLASAREMLDAGRARLSPSSEVKAKGESETQGAAKVKGRRRGA